MAATQSRTARISSSATNFYKRSFSLLWLGIAVLVVLVCLLVSLTKGIPSRGLPAFIIVPSVFTFLGILFRRLFRDLVDEVDDYGDYLLISNGGEQEKVPLTNVMNVSASTLTNPPRVTLRLVKSGRFGDEISFIPVRASLFNPLARNPKIDDLIVRVDRARAHRVF